MNFIKFITSLVIPNNVSCCLVSYFLLFKITWACALFTLLYKRLKNCNFQASSGYQYQREHEAYRSLHCRLFIYSNVNIPHVDENMLSVGEKTILLLPSLLRHIAFQISYQCNWRKRKKSSSAMTFRKYGYSSPLIWPKLWTLHH